MTRLFVYGTLLRGESHHHLIAHCEPVGATRTAAGFSLLHLGDYPALVDGGTDAVAGELYVVDAATLATLDRFEEHPEYYRRRPVALADGSAAEAYVLRAEHAEGFARIVGGNWRRRATET